tara:strand:- start:416 stop:655 length:240 start_codon:yes stop_codon:yes gene_type:complete
MQPTIINFHKATAGHLFFVDDLIIKITKEITSGQDEPDYRGQGARMAHLLLKHLPGKTFLGLLDEMHKLKKETLNGGEE